MNYSRRGFTLVEALLAVTLSSIALATVGVMLHGVFRVQRSMSGHAQFIDHLSRLAEHFRNDVHQAKLVEPAGKLCVVSLSDGKRIEYRIETDGVSRTVRNSDQVLQRDTHFLPVDFTGQWNLDPTSAETKPIAELLIGLVPRDDSESSDDLRQFRIDAVVGLTPPEMNRARGEK